VKKYRIQQKINIVLRIGAILTIFFFASSCDKFKGDHEIPAYIQIDTFVLVKNPLIEEGTQTQNIKDIWVFVDDQTIGPFEIPALVPVLESGTHELTILPGILYNGMSGTRGPYPFMYPMIIEDYEFIIDSVKKITPVTSYRETTFFAWFEDFEDNYISLEPTNQSDTTLLFQEHDPADPNYGTASGIAHLNNDYPVLECATNVVSGEGIDLPTNGLPVFLEMDYNINHPLVVGLFAYEFGDQITQHPVVVVNPTNGEWKKIYINFSPTLSSFSQADFFNIFIRCDKVEGYVDPVIMIDNFKLIHSEAK
jgi:hypothetical protein